MARIAIRVDASRAMSLGHLTRCLTLADALKARGAEVVFLCAPSIENWRDMVALRGHTLSVLPVIERNLNKDERGAAAHADWLPWGWRADAEATLAALRGNVDWLIVDHYTLDARWEIVLRNGAAKIMVIDDLADRPHECDLLLDQNAQGPGKDRYAALIPAAARRLIGPSYALLRPQFAAARGRVRDGSVKRILVFMSAMDSKGATLRALEALLSSEALRTIPVDVVIGAASPHVEAIKARAADHGRTKVHIDTEDMAALCAAADFAIGAGGVAALERCCVALPSMTLSIAANQEPGLAALAAAGVVRHLGRLEDVRQSQFATDLERLLIDEASIAVLSKRAAALVDGRGAERCAATILGPIVALRKATMEDARRLRDWRNEESVRLLSLNPEPIVWSDHCAWLERKLRDPNHRHWIGESVGDACGSVRFDIAEGKAQISIVVAPDQRGAGLGGRLLAEAEKLLLSERPDIKEFIAEVLPNNAASRRLFSRNGYELSSDEALSPLRYIKFARSGPA
jgi:UDP-2,4-diacetamido-2,4,6-trideoxy-beta-L-altropyranose hydrolase